MNYLILAALAVFFYMKNTLKLRLPVEGSITSKFGSRIHPVSNISSHHNGVDIAAPEGMAVRTPMKGKVINRYENATGGKQLVIDHGNGYVTGYAHLQDYDVRSGDNLKENQVIGWVGSTGIVTGPHLHFTVKKNGKYIDPLSKFFPFQPKSY